MHSKDHQEFYDWQELELVDTMVENQTEFAKCKVCWNQGNFYISFLLKIYAKKVEHWHFLFDGKISKKVGKVFQNPVKKPDLLRKKLVNTEHEKSLNFFEQNAF